MAELPPRPAGLVIGKERARGSYGTVYSGELDGKPVVVKIIHELLLQAQNSDKLMRDFYNECRILSTVRHANVVSFVGAYWDKYTEEPLLVMEAAKENLRQYLQRNKAQITVEKQMAICSSMAEGLSFLHARAEPIVHRDLKPENVLVWEDGTIKIADFGQSKLLDHPQNYMMTTQPGTVAYMPPEALEKNPRYTSKVDVFSLGAVMIDVSTQHPPSVCLGGIGTVPEVERHKDDLARLPDTHPLKPLIVWCLQDKHESRPNVKTTLYHIKSLTSGLKEPGYQRRLCQLESERKKHQEREMGLQGELEKARQELRESEIYIGIVHDLLEEERRKLKETEEASQYTNHELQTCKSELTAELSSTRGELLALKATKGREEGLQQRLEETAQELVDTKGREEGLQQRLEETAQELVDTKGREEGMQRRLEETAQELVDTKGREEGMQRRLEETAQELVDTKGREEGMQRRLEEATKEVKVTKGWLEKATQELRGTKRRLKTKRNQLEASNHELDTFKSTHMRAVAELSTTREELMVVCNQLKVFLLLLFFMIFCSLFYLL